MIHHRRTILLLLAACLAGASACGGAEGDQPSAPPPQAQPSASSTGSVPNATPSSSVTKDDLGTYCDPWHACAEGTECAAGTDGLDAGLCTVSCHADADCPDGAQCISDICLVGPRIDWSARWTGDFAVQLAPGQGPRYLNFTFSIAQNGATSKTRGLASVGIIYFADASISAVALGDVIIVELTTVGDAVLGGTSGTLKYHFVGRLARDAEHTYMRGRGLGPLAELQNVDFFID